MTSEFRTAAQAHATAQQYADLQTYLADLTETRRQEIHVLVKMVLAGLLVTWIFYQVFTTTGSSPMPAATALFVSAWYGFIPAGIIGMKRRRSRDSYILWGPLLYHLFLFMIYIMIGLVAGPFFLIAQICRIIKVSREIPRAKEQLNNYRKVIYGQ